jgi:hypothetical protein
MYWLAFRLVPLTRHESTYRPERGEGHVVFFNATLGRKDTQIRNHETQFVGSDLLGFRTEGIHDQQPIHILPILKIFTQ